MARRMFALVAVSGALAASAVIAAGAAAAEPAFFECATVAHGEFKNQTCTEGGQHGAGRHELVEGIGKKHNFVAKGHEILLITTPEEDVYQCSKTNLRGEYTSPTTVGNVIITLHPCQEGAQPCASPNHTVGGVIQIGPLSGSLGYIDAEKKEVGVDLTREGGGPLAELGCGKEAPRNTIQLNGSLIFSISGDVNAESKAFDLVGGVERLEGGLPSALSLFYVGTGEEEALEPLKSTLRGKGAQLEIKA
jgi:hypothetical protein